MPKQEVSFTLKSNIIYNGTIDIFVVFQWVNSANYSERTFINTDMSKDWTKSNHEGSSAIF